MAVPPVKLVTEVKNTLIAFSPLILKNVDDGMLLHRDLGIDEDNDLKALAGPFQRITREFKQGGIVTRNECKQLETVKDCVTLVATKAGFDGEK